MTKRIFYSIFLVAAAVLLVCLAVVMGVLYQYFASVQRSYLKMQTELAAQGIEKMGVSYFDGLSVKDYRLTWVAADGTVLFDSQADATVMENHAQREEITQALAYGRGESGRYSATLAEKTLYLAQRLDDGTVLRLSVTQYTVLALLLGMLRPILLVLVAAILLSAWAAHGMSQRIVDPLNTIDLERPLENEAYEELSPLLLRIEQQHRQIEGQVNELQRKKDEFAAVTGSMSEGLILLNDSGVVLSMNEAACKLFQTDKSCVGRDFLAVDRSPSVRSAVNAALGGGHGETRIERDNSEYQLDASPILSDERVTGVAVLVFDVTERAFAEKRRREFTANVSHELKTPLQSILGSAELLQNGLVKPQDTPRFLGHIHSEASRLVVLIDDILRLSQLDEERELVREEVDLLEVCRDVASSLEHAAAARTIRLKVEGESVRLNSVRRLLHEIVYNLCDNAIKYNVENGEVRISTQQHAATVVLTVSDTGIGISPQEQPRVFERFYRVDKSHSKETGGTGLGLSIVKHAAQYLGAVVELSSKVGAGTTVTLKIPR